MKKFNYGKDFIISIKNPIDYGYDTERIEDILIKMKDVLSYWWHYFIDINTHIPEVNIIVSCVKNKKFEDIKSCFPECKIIEEAKGNMGYYRLEIFDEI